MYVLLVQVDVKPEHHDAFVTAAGEHARRARQNEPGTIRFDVIADESDPNRLYYYEVYLDKAAFDAHAKGESVATYHAETQGWSNGPTTVRRGETTYPPNDDGAYWHK
ncbi:MAG: antibiotic biosynthesis monooxygenase [Chloroflexota bacterium]|nr:antibiotic biosynthesis monooxygenase [Chloroflexota bacterium]